MEIRSYIQTCIDLNDVKELTLAWYYAGGNVCNNETLFYKSNSLYKVDNPDSVFNNYILYCNADYNGNIDWANINSLDEAHQTTLKDGLTADCFVFYETPLDVVNLQNYLEEAKTDETYKPFTKYIEEQESENIIIDDDQYYQIMQVIGQPFIKDRELEYNRDAILKLAVEPALRLYYTYYPLIQEQVVQHGVGEYLIPYPTKPYPAYKALAWVTSAGAMLRGTLGVTGMSPLAALGTDVSLYTRTASGGSFANGLRYSKRVPGFTGTAGVGDSNLSSLATAWPLANTLKNISRREHLAKIHIPGKGIFAKGYSSMSGFLNIRWLCWSRDFNDVEFEDWSKVLSLCQAHVKVSIGAIRELLRTDSNVPFKEGMEKDGQDAINEWVKKAEEDPYRLIYTPQRGGVL